MNRLDRFINADDGARAKVLKRSAIAGFAWFLIAVLVFRLSDEIAGYSAIAVVFAVYLLSAWYYCASQTVPIMNARVLSKIGQFTLAIGTAGILVFLYITPANRVQANILQKRLVAATDESTLSPSQLSAVTNNLRIARNNRVRLPSPTLLRVRDALITSAGKEQGGAPEISEAANALGQYSRMMEPEHENESEFEAARQAVLTCADRGSTIWQPPSGLNELNAVSALAACTHAVELADGFTQLKITALQLRAVLEISTSTKRDQQALSDANEAQTLGSLELSTIFMVKGIVLARDQNLADKKQAVSYLLLCSHMDPSSIVGPPYLYFGGIFGYLAMADYQIQNYEEAAESARRALRYVPVTNPLGISLYRLIIVSDLQMEKHDDAMRVALELLQKTDSQQARLIVQTLITYSSDPQRAISIIGPDFRNPWGD